MANIRPDPERDPERPERKITVLRSNDRVSQKFHTPDPAGHSEAQRGA